MKAIINNKPSHLKPINEGDVIVTIGGRTGKDGIHGATFSSEELHEKSPVTAVQIGDPFSQKKTADFLHEARDKGLYATLTDMGAGGLSSAIGEMAQISKGCVLELEKVPLKYPGLKPWEILLSESQERMMVVVPNKDVEEFISLAKQRSVEASAIGHFTSNTKFLVTHKGKIIYMHSFAFSACQIKC